MRLVLFNLVTDVDDPILGFTTRWIRALAKRMDCIHVISMRAGRVEVPDNVRVYSVGKERGYTEPRRALEFYRHLFHILRQDKIDLCFSHMIPIFTVLSAPVLKMKGIPIVTWYAHRQVTTILKLAHHVSERMIASATTAYQYKHDKLVVLGQGIDTKVFSPGSAEPADPHLLLCIGRLARIKDLLTLIKAVSLLRQRGYGVRCTLVGDAPERERCYAEAVRSEVQALGLADSVTFAGSIPNERIVYWYRRSFAHINLCPTGALDKAALEAMACGRPSLVANEGFRETLGPWEELLLFRYGAPEHLAEKLEHLLQLDLAELQTMSEDLRQSVMERHSLERLVDHLVRLFHEVKRR